MNDKIQTAVFAGGCFWCTEAVFQRLRGVQSVTSGYAGGANPNPTYEQVSMGNTGHAEAIKFEYDPEQISFHDLLEVFFATHNPTELNRQGADVGTQYRSAIFYVNEEQRAEAEKFIKQVEADGVFDQPIVTTLEKLTEFYPAEDYHKDYYNKNKDQPYCQVVINPKLKKFKEKFASLLKPE
ncbi:MAG: peptide-methionine (S)-S-oxide reductase MsrA [Candidatus Doudnabacteria bacterium]|nr:peptide-methionine (S)-S-oxide reductase MsrA [Candidatus Doudnabacteria bacterium]